MVAQQATQGRLRQEQLAQTIARCGAMPSQPVRAERDSHFVQEEVLAHKCLLSGEAKTGNPEWCLTRTHEASTIEVFDPKLSSRYYYYHYYDLKEAATYILACLQWFNTLQQPMMILCGQEHGKLLRGSNTSSTSSNTPSRTTYLDGRSLFSTLMTFQRKPCVGKNQQ